jgi:DNA helicase HerA-like ATPase
VCEEAHRYVPRDDHAGFAPTKRSISRIAKEGRNDLRPAPEQRQRPRFARNAVPDSSRWLIEALPALNTQEALVLGDGVSVPMHIRFDDLPPERRPSSTKPPFSEAWQEDSVADI